MVVSHILWPGRRPARLVGCLILVLIILVPAPATAAAPRRELFASLQQRLIRGGFETQFVQRLYARPSVKFDANNISYLFTYRESRLNYDQFAALREIKKAKKYIRIHKPQLLAAEKRFGVPKEVVTAIILVETRLGKYTGRLSVFNSLSTLAALTDHPPRAVLWTEMTRKKRKLSRKKFELKASRKAGWAFGELKAFLTYAQQNGIDPAKLPGSISGAVGIAQFMPSNILVYGQDGNADGRIDLHDHDDAIASVANYLREFGWQRDISREKAAKVIWGYNHSRYYVNIVLKVADLLQNDPQPHQKGS